MSTETAIATERPAEAGSPAGSSCLLTVVMPCLNEAETLAACIRKARNAIAELAIEGEIVIADNGSTDGSQEIARREGARVIDAVEKGYGNALRAGIAAARGQWIIMGDADDSYDFGSIAPFVEKLQKGYELVMGCRMPAGKGHIEKGAMPWKHRWIGNPVLTFLGRLFFGSASNDFHCGLRAFTREAFDRMQLCTTGMEFASEMVIKATLCRLRVAEVPITLRKDGRSRAPHLRSWRDGWRHLRFMLLHCPTWLYLVPAYVLIVGGGCVGALLTTGPVKLGRAGLDTNTLLVCSMAVIIGVQLAYFGLFARLFAGLQQMLPPSRVLNRLMRLVTLERGLLAGVGLGLLGGGLLLKAFLFWKHAGFGGISYPDSLRQVIPAITLITLGVQVCFGSFMLGLLQFVRTTPKLRSLATAEPALTGIFNRPKNARSLRIGLIYDHVYPWHKGGGEKALLDLAHEFRQRGHEVHYFCMQAWDGPRDLFADGIYFHGVCAATGTYTADGQRTWLQPVFFAIGLFRRLWEMRREPFDVFSCTVFPFFSVLAFRVFRILTGGRTAWVLNWLEVWGYEYWRRYMGGPVRGAIGAAIEWLCARCGSEHLVISQLQAQRLEKLLGVPRSRIQIISRGLHLPELPAPTPVRRSRVLYAGRLIDYKNVETVLRAWRDVRRACPDATFRVIGDGPNEAPLRALAAELGVGESVEFVPSKETWREVMSEIGEASILVQPSIREGQSVIVLEAMGMGAAVIATRHPESAVSDFVRHGENGLLIDRWDDPVAWSEAIARVLNDPAERARLAEAGRAWVRDFDWSSALVPRIENYLRDAMAREAAEDGTTQPGGPGNPIPRAA